MKKILFSLLVFAGITATAQVKVGSNPTTLATDAKFQVEGSTGAQTVILNNGNVGIGTLTPASMLQVIGGNGGASTGISIANTLTDNTIKYGNVKVPQFLNASPPVQAFLMVNDATSNKLFIGGNNSGTQANPSEIRFFVDGDADLTNAAGPSFINAITIKGITGNVGIGTTAPTAKLEVKGAGNTDATTSLSVLNSDDKQLLMVLDNGAISTGGNFEINQQSTGNRASVIDLHSVDAVDYSTRLLRSGGASGGFFIRNQGTGNINLDAENVPGAEFVINGTTGNVGIGTTAPTAKLQVKSALNTSTTNAFSVLNIDDKQLINVFDDGVFSTGNSIEVNQLGTGDRASVLDFHSSNGVDNSARLLRTSGVDGNFFMRNTGTGNIILDNSTLAGQDFTINGTTGLIGIGTVTPLTRLDVSGTILARGSAIADVPGTQLTWNQTALGGSGRSQIVNHRGGSTGGFTFATTADGTTFETLLNIENTATEKGITQNQSGYFKVATGTTAERPAGGVVQAGMIRFNTTTSKFEGYNGTAWVDLN